MKQADLFSKFKEVVENYYQYNPDTLMPLLMVALAAQGKLKTSTAHSDNATVLYEICPKKVANYDWVRLDRDLKKRVKDAIDSSIDTICIKGIIEVSLKDIYSIFYHYDTFTVEEEFHHRIGILYQHSSNKASDTAHRQYAAINLAESLMAMPQEWLKENFLEVYHHILVRSGLQPKRPRLDVAYALNILLKYDGIGRVYNPFAGCAIAAAMIQAGENMYADGNDNDKLFAVARLLNYGMGGSNANYEQRDSTKWIDKGKFDYVMSTYRGYIDGKSAFDFCLANCFDTLADGGKFAGIAGPKDIFENPSAEFKEALNRDWVDTIVLLPFGEVAVLINSRKDKALKSKVKFFDFSHPMLKDRPVKKLLAKESYVQILRVADVKKRGYLRDLIRQELAEVEGYEIVTVGDFVRKMNRRVFKLDNFGANRRVLASINRSFPYNKFASAWMYGIEKRVVPSLFAPAYHLKADSLITNTRGCLDPRLFNADDGAAYFQDGYAFELKTTSYDVIHWLVDELKEPYVLRQLHPYGMNEMVPEPITEEQILNLKLRREIEEEIDNSEVDSENTRSDKLPCGFELTNNGIVYTIYKFLGNGSFGYAYNAIAKNIITGEEKEVVLKEFYPHCDVHREGDEFRMGKDLFPHFNIDIERNKFREEAKIMQRLGNIPNSHIVPVEEFFDSEKTATSYYVMPFYPNGSLEDLQRAGTTFTENLLLNNVVKPICKALHIAHKANVLHLDIKPENILLNDEGRAMLTDFGVAKQYDEEGSIINRAGVHGTSVFAAPEMMVKGAAMIKFGCEPDIFALAATLYNLATSNAPYPIQYNSDEDRRLRADMQYVNLSEGFANAIIAGLQAIAPARPRSAQAFLNNFPGCENIEF